jgi:hypothetical protein
VAPGVPDILRPSLADFVDRLPDAEISMAFCHTSDAANAVRLERAEAALVWSADEDRDLAKLTLRQVPVNLAALSPAG